MVPHDSKSYLSLGSIGPYLILDLFLNLIYFTLIRYLDIRYIIEEDNIHTYRQHFQMMIMMTSTTSMKIKEHKAV